MCLCAPMLVVEWKGRAFIEKVNSRCFPWFPAAILVDSLWRLRTKLYKGAWNVSANNSETVGLKDLGFGRIIYILVFYNISFSWLLPLNGFQFIFLCRGQVKLYETYVSHRENKINRTLRVYPYFLPIFSPDLNLRTSRHLGKSNGKEKFQWNNTRPQTSSWGSPRASL